MAISDIVKMNNGGTHEIKREDDDLPLASRLDLKRHYSSSDEDIPLATK